MPLGVPDHHYLGAACRDSRGSGIFAKNIIGMTINNMFLHHVYFWLKNPSSREDYEKLVDGLKQLSKDSNIKLFHIGTPANTNRSVIDRSYSVSWLLVFDDEQAEERYQVGPLHLKFVEECEPLWEKAVVYDSVNI